MTITDLHSNTLDNLPLGDSPCYLDYAVVGRDGKQQYYITDGENNTTRHLSRIAAIAMLNKLERKFNHV